MKVWWLLGICKAWHIADTTETESWLTKPVLRQYWKWPTSGCVECRRMPKCDCSLSPLMISSVVHFWLLTVFIMVLWGAGLLLRLIIRYNWHVIVVYSVFFLSLGLASPTEAFMVYYGERASWCKHISCLNSCCLWLFLSISILWSSYVQWLHSWASRWQGGENSLLNLHFILVLTINGYETSHDDLNSFVFIFTSFLALPAI